MPPKVFATSALKRCRSLPSIFAVDVARIEKSIPLKEDSTACVFTDGKWGWKTRTAGLFPEGRSVMETRDGQKVMLHGNEAMRLDNILHEDVSPVPPNLTGKTVAPDHALRLWIIELGIKGSGVPAWSKGDMEEGAPWDARFSENPVWLFLRGLPSPGGVEVSDGHSHEGRTHEH